MGQQQLLLLILSAIIVGVAIVVGINMFGQNAVQANQDAVTQDVLTLASRAQGWYRRPVQMGGGGRDFTGLNTNGPEKLNFTTPNDNGSYTLSGGTATELTIEGTGTEDAGGAAGPLKVSVKIFADSIGTMTVTP
jgi:hypothetical protein